MSPTASKRLSDRLRRRSRIHESGSMRLFTSWPGLCHGCPVKKRLYNKDLWTRLCFAGIARIETEAKYPMARQNIVLQEILRQLPWARCNALVTEHQADKHIRTLPARTMLITLLYAQLAGLAGLRETAGGTH